MKEKLSLLIVLLGMVYGVYGQSPTPKKNLIALRSNESIQIDGQLSEPIWQKALAAADFIEFEPNNGKPIPTAFKTTAKILYTNDALYIGMEMFDPQPDSILKQLTARDKIGTADFVILLINPLDDAQQDFEFGLTASNVQIDGINTLEAGEDMSWDAVWSSRAKITKTGWTAEFKIPFSALRFPKKSMDKWSINILRDVKRKNKKYTWTYVDRQQKNYRLYAGNLLGIKDIQPPKRLFFTPYASTYLQSFEGKATTKIKAGADIQWGLSDNFTLNAILIPDFGQTAFDKVQYNLTPFEQEFSEKRAFFTEGTELFSKGNLLYTRRIGQVKNMDLALQPNETLTNYPTNTNLINAVKLSGRTAKGLGIGIMNATTQSAYAKIIDSVAKTEKNILVAPTTNYNVLVLDQRFGKSNSIGFINTNVLREGHFYDANVAALNAEIFSKNNRYNFISTVKWSHKTMDSNKNGYWLSQKIGKVSGKNHYGINFTYVSKYFDNNDLGLNYITDYTEWNPWYKYRISQATKQFNTLDIQTGVLLRRNNSTGLWEENRLYFNFNADNKKNNYRGFGFMIAPFGAYDHYEPRTAGRYFKKAAKYSLWTAISPNYNKVFLIEYFGSVYARPKIAAWGYNLTLTPKWRVNDHLFMEMMIDYYKNFKDRGYVETTNNQIVFGERNQKILIPELTVNYNFNPKIYFNIQLRHYWTTVGYTQFFELADNGLLNKINTYTSSKDFRYNNWASDITIGWWFAPGSLISLLYRNTIEENSTSYNLDITQNYKALFQQPLLHIFSLKFTYFLDANTLRKKSNPLSTPNVIRQKKKL